MADSKQYIEQAQENGVVMISEDVIATIVSQAISEVDGVIGLSAKPGADIAEIIGKKNWGKGMKISISDNKLTVDCNVVIGYGQNVVTVAAAAQNAIGNALESMANIKVGAVNINICGIIRQ
ncbi:MAG: Asp23/Gls24 family envelope stress response protein [Ruminococcaceae bacterium]|nr:Asp23/Gls24 family envelope stress response protein [Oscillospiraceae bacterium]